MLGIGTIVAVSYNLSANPDNPWVGQQWYLNLPALEWFAYKLPKMYLSGNSPSQLKSDAGYWMTLVTAWRLPAGSTKMITKTGKLAPTGRTCGNFVGIGSGSSITGLPKRSILPTGFIMKVHNSWLPRQRKNGNTPNRSNR